ncbi:MAG TPA: enoyl-CoA hydratase-related protein, partial [Vicinamibacteria bacterium]|nr:enoyl-CoA hydratase-related protein [Vicinamibacteria bacterium]
MAYRNLRLGFEGRIAVLTVSRPEVRNALDTATVEELHEALAEVRRARATVLILTGAGDKAFVSGADIRAIRERRRDDALASINSRLMTAVEAQEA